MKKIKKSLALIMAAGMIFSSSPLVYANEVPASVNTANVEIKPFADELGYKFEYFGGVLFKRLWNYTKIMWAAGSYWMPAL